MSLLKTIMYYFSPYLSVVFAIAFTTAYATPTTLDVSKRLRECEKHFQANRLTSGKGGTALDCYQEVLKAEPTNAEALAGLEKIEARYVTWAKRALEQGQKNKVEGYLANLRKVNPDSSELAELEGRPSTPTVAPTQSDKPVSSSVPTESVDSSTSSEEAASPPQPTEEPVSEETVSKEEAAQKKEGQITDVGQVYELINTTECLTWINEQMKEQGGKNGWADFYPKKGDTGVIVAEMKHCHFDDTIYILKIDQYYVPMSSVGVQIVEP